MDEKINEINSEINEIYAMIDHFIAVRNNYEIRYWRAMLQQAKIKKREVAANR